MLACSGPCFVPIPLPRDLAGLAAAGSWDALLLGAPYVANAPSRPLLELARSRARTLLIDPKTAQYQFEGYMSMEEARAVPYSPGTATLGGLWQPRDFAARERRAELISQVFALQRAAGADLLLAPYFAVPSATHPWLEVAVETAKEAIRDGGSGTGAVVCVRLDAILGNGLEALAAAFGGLDPALWLVMIVDFDERLASPAEMRAALGLLEALGRSGAPVLPSFVGRFGLAAAAAGAAGCAGGSVELESHPQRYFREGLVNLHPNALYLPGALLRLPVALAEAVLEAEPAARGSLPVDLRPTRAVMRRRVQAALEAKRGEMMELAAAPDRRAYLRDRLGEALALCRRAQQALAGRGGPALAGGEFHYLEVILEVLGGPRATLPPGPEL